MSSALAPASTPTDNAQLRGWTLALVSMASFMMALDAMVVTTALGRIRDELSAPMGLLQWAVNAYNLSFGVLLITGAALGDRFGRRRVMSLGIGIFVVASVACATATGIGALIAARALQGAGAALVMPLAMAILGATYSRELRARALGIFGSVTGLALILGPAVGGAVAQGLDWPWIFWINVPIGILLIALMRRHIPESRGAAAGLDYPGLLLATASAGGMVWALMRGHQAGWTSPEIAFALAVGLLCAAGFLLAEQRVSAPMVPLHLFARRDLAAGTSAGFLFYASLYATVFFLPQYFQMNGAGPFVAGLELLPFTATLFVVAPMAGKLVKRFGERKLVTVGVLLQAIGLGWLAMIAGPFLAYVATVPALIVAGVGISLAMPAAQNAVIGAVAPVDIGKASGVFNMARYLGGVFGVALLVEVFSSVGGTDSPQMFSSGFSRAMAGASVLALLGAFAGAYLTPMRRPEAATPRAGA
ncbi:DHA2 family efflux MFS transporter permease subunit [soil metagenome]